MEEILGMFGLAAIIFGGIMAVLLFLMPLFVAFMYGELKRIRKAVEEQAEVLHGESE